MFYCTEIRQPRPHAESNMIYTTIILDKEMSHNILVGKKYSWLYPIVVPSSIFNYRIVDLESIGSLNTNY